MKREGVLQIRGNHTTLWEGPCQHTGEESPFHLLDSERTMNFNQSTCVLWMWKRHLTTSLRGSSRRCFESHPCSYQLAVAPPPPVCKTVVYKIISL